MLLFVPMNTLPYYLDPGIPDHARGHSRMLNMQLSAVFANDAMRSAAAVLQPLQANTRGLSGRPRAAGRH
jgi:hypothetical protein